MRRALLLCVLAAAVAVLAGALHTGSALAYGSADKPIAQVEISGNCNNPSFGLCQEVGLGGVWAWAELDTAGGSATGGSMDYTIAFCGHAGPGGGPHSIAIVPAVYGHYGMNPVPGVAIQTQVAP